jgi:hypothetical protein
LFIVPHCGLNQQFDHFVVSSEVPENSSSNLRLQLPATPVGNKEDGGPDGPGFDADGEELTGGRVGETVGVGIWVGESVGLGVGEYDGWGRGLGELECVAEGEALTGGALGAGRCCQ